MPGDGVRVVIDDQALTTLFASGEGAVGRDLERRALAVERAAKRLCPVDTGRLRSSIAHDLARDARGLLAMIGTNVSYGPFVEFGTSRARAQPFLRPALSAAGGPSVVGS